MVTGLKIIYGVITVIMLLLCVEDIRQKEISWWKLVILGVICLVGCVMLPDKNLWSMAGGVAIGLCGDLRLQW